MDKDLLGHSPNALGIAIGVILANLLDTLRAKGVLTRTEIMDVFAQSDIDLNAHATMDPVIGARGIIKKMTTWFPEDGS